MSVTCFETRGTPLIDAIETVENVKSKLKKVEYSEGITIYKKFELVIENKLGFKTLTQNFKTDIGKRNDNRLPARRLFKRPFNIF